ncbi:MAG: molybdopterin molybdotransferase MoeA [Algoriphagus sp.]|nr:molybdopterin molybdotransferase MoeA [Algoriphagus sp.]
MVSVSSALSIINQHVAVLNSVVIPLERSLGYVLAEDIFAPISLPPFRQSAMDGYALRHGVLMDYVLVGECKAGDFKEYELVENQAVRIFTGARVPDQADTVIIQENIKIEGSRIQVQQVPKPFSNIRPMGEQVKKGELIAKKGAKINAAFIGFLAGFGLEEVLVNSKPKIALIVTGNELQGPGNPLKPGAVYETNGITIQNILAENGFSIESLVHVPDEERAIEEAIFNALAYDLVLISGGISVGDYDFVKAGLESNRVEEKFYKINQKPAKPIWFGKKDKSLVFALPGNPASMLMCMLVYVIPAVRKMVSGKALELNFKKGILNGQIENRFKKSLFLLAIEEDGIVEILEQQACSMLISFAQSNTLVYVDETLERIEFGGQVRYIPINRS